MRSPQPLEQERDISHMKSFTIISLIFEVILQQTITIPTMQANVVRQGKGNEPMQQHGNNQN